MLMFTLHCVYDTAIVIQNSFVPTVANNSMESWNFLFSLQYLSSENISYLLERAPMLKRAPPFENQKLNEHLPRISTPLFPLKGRSFETDLLLKGHSIGIRSKTLIHGLTIFLC